MKLLGLPVRLVKKLLGGKKAAPTPPPAPRPAPKPRPKVEVEGGGGHAHSHDHGGGHDHGHSHGGEPKPAPEPVLDHGHSHDHGGAPAAKPAKPAKAAPEADVGAHIRIDVSETPNPNARKFTCSVTVIEKGSLSFNAPDEAATHPLGKYVWAIGGVKGIFAVKDFVTVTKTTEADWNDLSPKIIPAIRKGLVERGV